MIGKTVTVKRKTVTYDANRNPVEAWAPQIVNNVIVVPGATSDISESMRPDGTVVAFTLAFPKSFSSSLRGCRVVISGEGEFSVIGDPRPCRENCPTQWWITAEVEACDG